MVASVDINLPVLGAEHVGVNIEGIVLATTTVTVVPISATTIALVQGSSNCVLVGLKGVILRTP